MGKKATGIAFTLVVITICDTLGGEPGQPGGIFGGGGGGGGGQPGMPGGIYGGGGGGGFWGIPGRPGGINGGGGGGGGGQPGKPGGILGGGGGGGGGGQPGLPGGYYEYYYPGHYFTSLPTGNTKERKTWLAALFRKYLAELDEDDDLLVLRKKRHSKIN